jgi:hypothetical protein
VIVGRLKLAEPIPVVSCDEPPAQEQRAAVGAPNAIDRTAECKSGAWEAHC